MGWRFSAGTSLIGLFFGLFFPQFSYGGKDSRGGFAFETDTGYITLDQTVYGELLDLRQQIHKIDDHLRSLGRNGHAADTVEIKNFDSLKIEQKVISIKQKFPILGQYLADLLFKQDEVRWYHVDFDKVGFEPSRVQKSKRQSNDQPVIITRQETQQIAFNFYDQVFISSTVPCVHNRAIDIVFKWREYSERIEFLEFKGPYWENFYKGEYYKNCQSARWLIWHELMHILAGPDSTITQDKIMALTSAFEHFEQSTPRAFIQHILKIIKGHGTKLEGILAKETGIITLSGQGDTEPSPLQSFLADCQGYNGRESSGMVHYLAVKIFGVERFDANRNQCAQLHRKVWDARSLKLQGPLTIGNQRYTFDPQVLRHFKNVKEVELISVGLTEISELDALPSELEVLRLDSNSIENWEAIAESFPRLRTLSLRNNPVMGPIDLASLQVLKDIDLLGTYTVDRNEVQVHSPENIERLAINAVDLSFLPEFPNLTYLEVNGIEDLDSLSLEGHNYLQEVKVVFRQSAPRATIIRDLPELQCFHFTPKIATESLVISDAPKLSCAYREMDFGVASVEISNSFNGDLPYSSSKPQYLTINLTNDHLKESDSSEFKVINSFRKIEVLRVKYNDQMHRNLDIDDGSFTKLDRFYSIYEGIPGCKDNPFLNKIKQIKNISVLNILNCDRFDPMSLPHHPVTFNRLDRLSIDGLERVGSQMAWSVFRGISELSITSTSQITKALENFKDFSSLQTLRLSGRYSSDKVDTARLISILGKFRYLRRLHTNYVLKNFTSLCIRINNEFYSRYPNEDLFHLVKNVLPNLEEFGTEGIYWNGSGYRFTYDEISNGQILFPAIPQSAFNGEPCSYNVPINNQGPGIEFPRATDYGRQIPLKLLSIPKFEGVRLPEPMYTLNDLPKRIREADTDGDGVIDLLDVCPNTKGDRVIKRGPFIGCEAGQKPIRWPSKNR